MTKRKTKINFNKRELLRFFGNLPIVEAENELRIQPNKKDIKSAVRGDSSNCVFSRACQRLFGAKAVFFYRKVAYVDLLSAQGNRQLERFIVPAAGERFIRDFDTGKNISAAGFILYPAKPSQTLDRNRETGRKHQAKKKLLRRQASLNGETIVTGALRPKRKGTVSKIDGYRDGRGMVHFPKKKK